MAMGYIYSPAGARSSLLSPQPRPIVYMAKTAVPATGIDSQICSGLEWNAHIPLGTLARACLLVVVFLGALYAWDGRNAHMVGDGISYLDMADAIAHGHWAAGANATWSPLYPLILAGALAFRPSGYWEPTAVHFVNFLIYLAALACFHSFWAPLVRKEPAWMIFGYAIFAWSSLHLITVSVVTPDLLFSALVYLALGMLHRAGEQESLPMFAATGAVLSLGYLARAVMFPLAFGLCGIALLLRQGLRQTFVMFLGFFLLSAPLVATLSHATGHLTFSDEGRIAYLTAVESAQFTFTAAGQPLIGLDTPVHPVRRLHAAPDVLDTQNYPIHATYPIWYDPSHWFEGAKLRFQPRGAFGQFESAWRPYVYILFSWGALPAGLIVLWLNGGAWRRPNWLTLLWAVTALAAFAIVHVEPRLVGTFVVLLWLWTYRGFFGASLAQTQSLILVVALALLVPLLAMVPQMTFRAARDLATHQVASTDWEIASALLRKGLRSGDCIAYVGEPIEAYFTRLARLTVSTWIPTRDVEQFWALDTARKSTVFSSMIGAGAKVVVAQDVPPEDRSDWERVGNTSFYIHSLVPPDFAH